MRKLLLSLLLTVTGLAAYGQKNEISILLGPTVNGFTDVYGYNYGYRYNPYGYGGTLSDLYEPTIGVSASGSISLEYHRAIASKVKLGGSFHYGYEELTRTPGAAFKDDPQVYTRHFFSLTPQIKYDYIRGSVSSHGGDCNFYAKALAGVGIKTGGLEDTRVCFDYGVYPLGVQVVINKLSLLGELGYGSLYIMHLGIGYQF